jgi:ADP-heptose:LPS heptosyltransferase
MGQPVGKEAPYKIAILRALQLGDLLCSVPAMRALRTAYPEAHISLIGLPWAESFVRRFSAYLDDFLEFPGWPGLPEQEPQTRRIPDFLRRVQIRQFDLALQMQGSGSITNSLVMAFGARQAAGFCLPGQYQPDARFFPVYPERESEIRTWLKLLSFLGIPSRGEDLEFPLNREERQEYARFLAEHHLIPGRYACLHPGARDEQRRWPPEKFAAVGDYLAEMGLQVVLTGTQNERPLTTAVSHQMHFLAMNVAGQTDLGVMAQLIANARLLVSNDTGVSHIAAAFQTPSVILFSTSDPERWRPLNHPIHHAVLQSQQVEPEAVIDEVASVLREAAAHAR